MSVEYHCAIHGLVIASEVDLPLPRIEPRPADVTFRVALNATGLPLSTHIRVDDPDDPWAVEHWIGTRLAVEFPGWATFELSRTDVVLLTDDADDPDLITHLLLDHVLPRVVALRGDLMLHAAAAVGPSGRAHLFLGGTGAGKSTMVTELVSNGWLLLDDDNVRVIESDHGFHVFPGTAGVRLLPDSAAALVPDLTPGRPMSRGSRKRRFAIDGTQLRMAIGPAPIAALYLLAQVDVLELSVERMGLADALGALTEHGFHMAEEPTSITRNAFERASALAAVVPVFRLSSKIGLHYSAATRAFIAKLDAGS